MQLAIDRAQNNNNSRGVRDHVPAAPSFASIRRPAAIGKGLGSYRQEKYRYGLLPSPHDAGHLKCQQTVPTQEYRIATGQAMLMAYKVFLC